MQKSKGLVCNAQMVREIRFFEPLHFFCKKGGYLVFTLAVGY